MSIHWTDKITLREKKKEGGENIDRGKKRQTQWSPVNHALWRVQSHGEWEALIPVIDAPVLEPSSTEFSKSTWLSFPCGCFDFGCQLILFGRKKKKKEVAGSDV